MTDLNQLLKEAIEDLEAWADYFGDERSKEAAKDVAGLARCGTASGLRYIAHSEGEEALSGELALLTKLAALLTPLTELTGRAADEPAESRVIGRAVAVKTVGLILGLVEPRVM